MSQEKEIASTKGKKVKNDIILVSALLGVILLAILGILLFRQEGNTVTVSVGKQTFGTYSLHENKTVEIKTDNGYNVLIIKDGKAYIKNASCPDGICAKHKPISYGGQSIICLPNEVVVEVKSQSEPQLDIIS